MIRIERKSCYPPNLPAMADVFLSYAREDRRVAGLLAQVISQHGWSVWSDQQIRVGTLFPRIIEREIDAAACVVVVWSRHSVDSDWVRLEAWEGLSRNVLVPVTIETSLRLPLEFRRLHTADLSRWPQDETGLAECIAAIRELVAHGAAAAALRETPSGDTKTAVSGEARRGHGRSSEALHSRQTTGRRLTLPQGKSARQAEMWADHVALTGSTLPSHDVHHLQHHAVTPEPMAQYRPMLWSEARTRNYVTIKHPAVLGALFAFGLLLILILLMIWLETEQAQVKGKLRGVGPATNFGVKLSRSAFGPSAEPAVTSLA